LVTTNGEQSYARGNALQRPHHQSILNNGVSTVPPRSDAGRGAGSNESAPGDTTPQGQPVEDDDDQLLAPGTMVGEYRVEHRIGSGGMGIVFAAVHPLIGKRVAIKVLKADVCNDAVAVERFIDEARIVNQIEHPNIVDIFAFGQMPDGRQYFVMEWLRGRSLRVHIESERLTVAQTCSILIPLTRALLAAHELGIVHRDLKPDNVFLDERGAQTIVKLLDFGVAKLSKTDQRNKRLGQTATGTIVGTPTYLSPEQAKGVSVDQRADIYALGAIAFEALTGRPPFIADTVMEMVAKHLMEPPVQPSAFEPNLPPELDRLVVATLAKSPDVRPTLATWLQTLERVQKDLELESQPRIARRYETPYPPPPVIATPPPEVAPVPVMPTPVRSRRWIGIALAAMLLVGVGVGAAVYYGTSNSNADEFEHVTAPPPNPPAPTAPVAPTALPAPVEPKVEPTADRVEPTPAPAKQRHRHSHAGSGSSVPHKELEPAGSDDDPELLEPGSLGSGSGSSLAGSAR
jgi:serine/threonine-protein kinase